jgi:hypothetical protein
MAMRSTLHPLETPVIYTTRELAEMRDRLAVKYAREGADLGNQKYFNDVLRQLDNLMKPIQGRDYTSESRRVVSAPPDYRYLQGSVDVNSLDVIPEEGWVVDADERKVQRQQGADCDINASPGKRGHLNDEIIDTTIRVVTPSPSHVTHNNFTTAPWAPLNIRKSSTSTKSSSTSRSDSMINSRHPGSESYP